MFTTVSLRRCYAVHGTSRRLIQGTAGSFGRGAPTDRIVNPSLTFQAVSSVMTGYLALLIARIATKVTSARKSILSTLPGQSARLRLEGLSSSLGELTGLQTVVKRKLRDMAGQIDENEIDGSDDQMGKDDDVVRRVMDDLKSLTRVV
jgi:hypothetical protein